MSVGEPVRIVLESDGTQVRRGSYFRYNVTNVTPRWQVEDGEYFQTLPENTIFIVLRPGEAWAPVGEDIVSQGGSGAPLLAQ